MSFIRTIHSCLDSRSVAVVTGEAAYLPREASPYHPSERYPEYGQDPVGATGNSAYRLVRQVLADLGLDREHFGTPLWNPIGNLVAPGASIVVKPNWVLHKNLGPGGMDCMVTHPAIVRAALDYVFLANPREVVLGDAPLQGCDLNALLELGFAKVIDYFVARGQPLRLADFRRTILAEKGQLHFVSEDVRPLDSYVIVDLGVRSFLEPIARDSRRFRVTMYDPRAMFPNHAPGIHRYCIAREVLEADLVLNLPKLKTHKKAGITAALKNLVGINGHKEFLPHHRKGSRPCGGDNYEHYSFTKARAEDILDWANMWRNNPRLNHLLVHGAYALTKFDVWRGGSDDLEGSWFGNDTVWRMCLDLNRILLYANAQGQVQEHPMRTELSIQDALVAGQGQGPLSPTPYDLGMVLGGLNPAAQDWIAALLLGLDPEKIPIVARAFAEPDLPLARYSPAHISATVNGRALAIDDLVRQYGHHVQPPAGWAGHCERPLESRP